jgi:hypothetical protein
MLQEEILSLKKIIVAKDTEISALKLVVQEQLNENQAKSAKLSNLTYSHSFFKGSDERTKHITGLTTYAHLNALFKRIEPEMPTKGHKLSNFQALILTLLRLRTGCTARDLGYRFDISDKTASRVFHHTLNLLYYKMKSLVFWPSREKIIKTMPRIFQLEFGNVVSIVIDCFEIYTEMPAALHAKSAMHSIYKNHNTVKVLIGITPAGMISFVSDGFTGHTSDKAIFSASGLADKLLLDDVVMCDRGFRIQNEVEERQAHVILPAFRKGVYQLDPVDVEETRNIANVRIHIERIIGSLRQKYEILTKILPIVLLTTHNKGMPEIDKILIVCCALVNMCPSIIPFA